MKLKIKKSINLFKKDTENKEVSSPSYKDLRSIMDKNRNFSIFFSGVENDAYFKGCYDMGVRNFLMSYHYLQKSRIPLKNKYEGLGIKFFIDSGAHTYQNDDKYLSYGLDYWEKHIQKYLSWVERNKNYIFAIANCDFENMIDPEVILEWNEKYFEPFMLRTGIPVCFVWHQNSVRDWDWYCKRYPYVGFSSVNTNGESISFTEYVAKLKIAEQNNSLVHGFGMTRTSILPKLPFYTVDSTSWKAGFMYGQIAIWTGKKVQLKGKEDFETKVFPILRAYPDITIDEDKIRQYYEPEVLRANVYAFLRAESFINECLKPLRYWQKPESQKRSSEDLSNIEYPSVEWLELPHGARPNVENYAKEFNISMENPDEAENLVIDMTCFMNWENSDYQDYINKTYTSEMLKEIHDAYINKVVGSDEDRIEDLKNFYQANLLGEDTTLLYLGTNFDRIIKEREDKDYVTDEEYEYTDIPELEMDNFFAKFLPAPKEGERPPTPSDIDDEVYEKNNIVPVRDSQGRFLKGQHKVLKPKKLYSEKYPKLACDRCMNAQVCPMYKAGYVCAYNKMFSRYNTRDMADVIQSMQGIADLSMQRLQRAMISETMNGGVPDPTVTGLMTQTMNLMTQLQRMYEYGNQEIIRQTKVMRADGSQETTTQYSNPQSGGILEKLFGGMNEKKPKKEEKEVHTTIESEPSGKDNNKPNNS